MARHKSDRKHFGSDGATETLPKGIYRHNNRLLVKLSVCGKQHSLGAYPDLTTATCERDRAYHLLSDWVPVPADIMPLSDLQLLPENKLLDRLLRDLADRQVPTLAQTRRTPLPPATATPVPKDERRERFALLALPSLISVDPTAPESALATQAVAIADALIARLDTPSTQTQA